MWNKVIGFSRYSVSDKGEVRNDVTGRILKPCFNGKYLFVTLYSENDKRSFLIHALVMESFKGPKPEGKVINHIDGNQLNNDLENLEYCTSAENSSHAVKLGLIKSGERSHKSKLNTSQVEEIKLLLSQKVKQKHIALKYGITVATVSTIKTGIRWKCLNTFHSLE